MLLPKWTAKEIRQADALQKEMLEDCQKHVCLNLRNTRKERSVASTRESYLGTAAWGAFVGSANVGESLWWPIRKTGLTDLLGLEGLLSENDRVLDREMTALAGKQGTCMRTASDWVANVAAIGAYGYTGASAWNACNLPTMNVYWTYSRARGIHFGCGVGSGGGASTIAGHGLGRGLFLKSLEAKEIAGMSSFTGIPILFPQAALSAALLSEKPEVYNCATAVLSALRRGWFGR